MFLLSITNSEPMTKMPADDAEDIIQQAQETFAIVHEISNLLKTGLEPEVLMCCMRLCEEGIPPEILSWVISEVKREVAVIMEEKQSAAEEINRNSTQ